MDALRSLLEKTGNNDVEKKLSQFEGYKAAVLEINRTLNLTRITDPEEFTRRHFAESLVPCFDPAFLQAERIIDVGTGAGFPGVPMAIAFPEKEFVLLDSLAKRMDAVRRMCSGLGISNVTCIHARAEDAARDPGLREAFDVCVSRAVAELNVLTEYCLPFVKVGGWFVPFKGKGYEEEMGSAAKAISVLGGMYDHAVRERDILPYDDGSADGTCLFIMKRSATPEKYPRPAGKPSRKPIR